MTTSITIQTCSADEYAVKLEGLRSPERSISFLQAPFYGAWQEAAGKTVVYYFGVADNEIVMAGLAVKYDAPGGVSFFYSPYGPVAREWSSELADAIRDFFKPICKQTGVTFLRLDNDQFAELPDMRPVSTSLAATASLQPRAEWLLDITDDQETIWMGFHKHARYNVRLAERAAAEMQIVKPSETPLDTFIDLMETTADRDSFSLHKREYYKVVLASIPDDAGFVILVNIGGKPAAVGLFSYYDGTVHYVFAGSSNDFRKIAPPYFLLWQAILESKKRGLRSLNFGGISDDVKGTHLAGVTAFKRRFGGYAVHHQNPVDFVYKPFRYSLFKLYKTIR